MLIAPKERYHNPRPKGPSNLRTLRPKGLSNLRTFYTTLLHNPPPIGGHNLRRSRAPLFNLRHSRHHNPQRQRRCQT